MICTEEFIAISEHICLIRQHGSGGPIIYWGTHAAQQGAVEQLPSALDALLPEESYCLVAYHVDDWNRDFSPWQMPAVFGTEGFGGQGRNTLRWLLEGCIPSTESRCGTGRKRYLAGYSLAGLFTLWAGYETNVFDGIISCSGSFWFTGWDAYAEQHRFSRECSVYLSLGRKEEKVRNQIMSQVGDRTRTQEEILKADPLVKNSILEWNPGGHFTEPGMRVAKGIRWMLEQEKNQK